MKKQLIMSISLAILMACTTPTSTGTAKSFIDSARGKVVSWTYQGKVYALDYVDPSKDVVLTAKSGNLCDKGTFVTNGNQICYNFSGDLRPTDATPDDCWTVSKTNSGYLMESKYSAGPITANITNLKPFSCQ